MTKGSPYSSLTLPSGQQMQTAKTSKEKTQQNVAQTIHGSFLWRLNGELHSQVPSLQARPALRSVAEILLMQSYGESTCWFQQSQGCSQEKFTIQYKVIAFWQGFYSIFPPGQRENFCVSHAVLYQTDSHPPCSQTPSSTAGQLSFLLQMLLRSTKCNGLTGDVHTAPVMLSATGNSLLWRIL